MSEVVTFNYKGLTFTPLRKFAPYEDFRFLSKRFQSVGIHNNPSIKGGVVRDWDHDEFYKAAGDSNKEVDVFLFENKQVVPCDGELFGYFAFVRIQKNQKKGGNNHVY